MIKELNSISSFGDPSGVGAMGAAEVFIIVLNSVTYDATATAETRWGKRLNGAFKTIEGIGVPRLDNVERLVVSVIANSAGSHSP